MLAGRALNLRPNKVESYPVSEQRSDNDYPALFTHYEEALSGTGVTRVYELSHAHRVAEIGYRG